MKYLEIYNHLLSKGFNNAVLGSQEMVQWKYFFWHQTKTWLLERFLGFWLCCRSISFLMSSELRFVKWVRFLERNCIIKCVTVFASFCWLWDFVLENLKLKKNSHNVHWKVWRNIKTLYARINIFKKRILNMRFWIIYILVQISLFGRLL